MKRLIILLFLTLIAWPSQAQSREERKQDRQERLDEAFNEAKSLVNEGRFEFNSIWITMRSGVRDRLDGGRGQLIIDGSESSAFLPYFGIVRVAAIYNAGAIKFEGEMTDYEVDIDDEQREITIAYKMSNRKEQYGVNIKFYKGLNATVTIDSNKRDTIYYDGRVKALDEE